MMMPTLAFGSGNMVLKGELTVKSAPSRVIHASGDLHTKCLGWKGVSKR
jgi:hypothetical protein